MKGRSENSFFDNLFRNNFNKVVSYLYLYSRDRELSENIAQDAFMALWENIEGVNEEKALGYVYTAARNKLINNFSKTMTSCRYNDYCRLKTVSLMRSVMESDTMHKIYGNEIESRLVDAMDRMNDKVRETFELSRFNGKKNKEIAEMAGISEKAVEFRIMSALRILREELSDFLIFIIMFWIIRD